MSEATSRNEGDVGPGFRFAHPGYDLFAGMTRYRELSRTALHDCWSTFPMNAPTAIPNPKPVPPYKHTPLFPLGADTTPYRKISSDGVRVEWWCRARRCGRLAKPRLAISTIICGRD